MRKQSCPNGTTNCLCAHCGGQLVHPPKNGSWRHKNNFGAGEAHGMTCPDGTVGRASWPRYSTCKHCEVPLVRYADGDLWLHDGEDDWRLSSDDRLICEVVLWS